MASDRRGRILFINAATERLLGWTAAELNGQPLTTIMPPRLRSAHEAGFQRFLATGQSRIIGRPIRVPALHRDGTEIDIELTLSQLDLQAPDLFVIAILRDLRERVELERQMEQTLDREEQLRSAKAEAEAARNNLQKLFHNAPAAIAVIRGPDMRYELSNAVNQELAGGRELVGKTVQEGLPELDAQGVTALVNYVYQTGQPYFAREYPVVRPARPDSPEARIFMNGVFQPLHGGDGVIEGVMLFAYEVTDLVTSRERVKEAEERLRLAVESARLGTWDYDPASGIVHCDARYRRLFGLGPETELTTAMLSAAIHPDDRPRVNEAVQKSFDPTGGGDYTAEYRTRGIEDGKERWVAVRGRTFFDDRQRPARFIGTGIDITDQKRTLERQQFLTEAGRILASSLEYRETLSQVAALAVARLVDWCAIELVVEGDAPELVAVAHADPEKVALARDAHARHPEDWQTAAGLRSAMVLPLLLRGRSLGVLTLARAEPGGTFEPEDLALGEELGRRLAAAIENARLYDQARRAIGVRDQFLSIASHELRTPLTSLTLQLSGLARSLGAGTFSELPPEKVEARIARMEQQVARLTGLIDELLDVSRISAGRLAIDRQSSDLVQIVREVLERLGDEASRAGCRLDLRAPETLVGFWDPNRLDQVLTNLVSNALKYAGGNPVEVEVTARGASALVVVRDHGPGVGEADQKRIFEQFERAAPSAMAGLGLGLWIARRIVEAHEGDIRVESRPGEGASFVVELPIRSSA